MRVPESEVIAYYEAKGMRWIATIAKPLHGDAYAHEAPREVARRARLVVVINEIHYAKAVYLFEQIVGQRCTNRQLIGMDPIDDSTKAAA